VPFLENGTDRRSLESARHRRGSRNVLRVERCSKHRETAAF